VDDLDRLAFRVARTVRTTYPHLLDRGFTLADLEERLAPYAETRRELAVGGPNGYEHTVLRLLAGERGYLGAEPELQEACRRALQTPSPTVALVRTWAGSALMLRGSAFELAGVATTSSTSADVSMRTAPSGGAAVADASTPGSRRSDIPNVASPVANDDRSCGCHFCGGRLPESRSVRFCPHCGLDLTVRQCPACSTELERTWRYCVTCGRQADEEREFAAPSAGIASVTPPSPTATMARHSEPPLMPSGLFA
jgi:hypothetical protein